MAVAAVDDVLQRMPVCLSLLHLLEMVISSTFSFSLLVGSGYHALLLKTAVPSSQQKQTQADSSCCIARLVTYFCSSPSLSLSAFLLRNLLSCWCQWLSCATGLLNCPWATSPASSSTIAAQVNLGRVQQPLALLQGICECYEQLMRPDLWRVLQRGRTAVLRFVQGDVESMISRYSKKHRKPLSGSINKQGEWYMECLHS